jgi:hypothetical protein
VPFDTYEPDVGVFIDSVFWRMFLIDRVLGIYLIWIIVLKTLSKARKPD